MHADTTDRALTVALFTGGLALVWCMCIMAGAGVIVTGAWMVFALYLGAMADGLV